MKKAGFLAITAFALLLSSAVAHASGTTVDQSDWLTAVHSPPPAAAAGHDVPVSLEVKTECSTVLFVTGCTSVTVTLSYDDHGVTRSLSQDIVPVPNYYSPESVAIASFVIPGDAVAGDAVTYSFVAGQYQSYCRAFICDFGYASVRSPAVGSHEIDVHSA